MCSTLIVQSKKGININCRVVDTCNEGLGEMFLSAVSGAMLKAPEKMVKLTSGVIFWQAT